MITINLGFDKNPHANKEDIILFFSNNFIINNDTFNYKEVEASYINPETKEEVKETTAVFNIHTKFQVDKEDIEYSIQQLCTIFNQDSNGKRFKPIYTTNPQHYNIYTGTLWYINRKTKKRQKILEYFN